MTQEAETSRSRRPHTKTRDGCQTCKARRVRCDETKPVCHNCLRGNRTCTYPNHLLIPSSSNDAPIFPLQDMELLHYWTATAHQTLTDLNDPPNLWQITITQWAFEHHFLLHGILAFSALHRKHVDHDPHPTQAIETARYHQQQALSLYIPLLHSITESNSHTLFAFSIVFGCLTFALLLEDPDLDLHPSPEHNLIHRFTDAADAFIGATVLGTRAEPWISQGPLKTYLLPPNATDKPFRIADLELQEAVTRLLGIGARLIIAEDEAVRSRAKACRKALWCLGTVLAQEGETVDMGMLIAWPVLAEAEFVGLLRRGDGFALAVLGHFGVALDMHGEALWMTRGLGRRLTLAARAAVGEEWHGCLEWAVRRVTMRTESEMVA